MEELSLRSDDSIETTIKENASTVYKLAYARMRNQSDAEDVFQEVFLRLVRRRPVFESKEHEKAWLIRVTSDLFRSCIQSVSYFSYEVRPGIFS